MKKSIAITGGIGSGKSTFANALRSLGYTVFGADEIYAGLLGNPDFVKEVCAAVGVAPLTRGDKISLDRKAVAGRVFTDAAAKKNLDNLTHKAIIDRMFEKIDTSDGLVFCEVPLLYECNLENKFDCVIVVIRSEDDRVHSVVARDGKSEELVRKIIKNQFDYSKLEKDGHTIFVENDGEPGSLREKARIIAESLER